MRQKKANRPQPNPPHTGGTFHRRCGHFTRKNTWFCAPASSPNQSRQSPCNIHAAITMRLQHHVANPHVSTHMATADDNNHVAIPLRSATTDSKTPCKYARASTSKATLCHRYSAAKKGKPTAAAPAAHRRYLLGGPGRFKYIARLEHLYNLLTKCCNLPYKWC